MASNLEKFKKDLARLIELGGDLELAMINIVDPNVLKQSYEKSYGKDYEEHLKKLPSFLETYQTWYSESLAVIKQLLPDRALNFISLYEKHKNRKELTSESYVIQDFLHGLSVTRAGKTLVDRSAALSPFQQQRAILKACEMRFQTSLFDIKQIVQADLFDCEIEAARELHRHKFFRAAGAVAGVVLERHLSQVCNSRNLEVSKKRPTISDLNEILKLNNVIEISQWRFISMLADIRNSCDHQKSKDPTGDQVLDLLDGTSKILKIVY